MWWAFFASDFAHEGFRFFLFVFAVCISVWSVLSVLYGIWPFLYGQAGG